MPAQGVSLVLSTLCAFVPTAWLPYPRRSMTEELFRQDAYLRSCDATVTAVGEAGIELDGTVFYPMGGGQPGDRGTIILPDGTELEIIDTRKGDEPGTILHVLASPPPPGLPGSRIEARVDWPRRHRLMRVHTTLHLLGALVPAGVTGGAIRDDGTGRLDFDLPDVLLDKESLTDGLNRLVDEDHRISARWVSEAELDANPDLVRTMSVTPPRGQGSVRLLEVEGVDLQACGGTHVATTSEIGAVRVRKIEKKGKHNRRVNVELLEP
jgi:misacylated tRNA(Ala) deacylase